MKRIFNNNSFTNNTLKSITIATFFLRAPHCQCLPLQEVMKGVQMVYDIATFRRPSQLPPGVTLDDVPPPPPPLPPKAVHTPGEPPGTPALSTFAIDDEFNLPISVAIFILLVYIFCGATVFYVWESWGFFESFYFVFISMSTIGFGDFVPQVLSLNLLWLYIHDQAFRCFNMSGLRIFKN